MKPRQQRTRGMNRLQMVQSLLHRHGACPRARQVTTKE
jgi:hypothetical protein